jgi:hypothetical protein
VNTKLAADAYNKISEGFAMLALAIEQPAAGGAKSSPPPTSPAPVDFDDLPPLTDADYGDPDAIEQAAPRAAEKPQNTALGACPVHRTGWTVKAGGISKNGKPYKAFWKCSGKTEDGYCNEKPTKAWADSHPIPLEVAA